MRLHRWLFAVSSISGVLAASACVGNDPITKDDPVDVDSGATDTTAPDQTAPVDGEPPVGDAAVEAAFCAAHPGAILCEDFDGEDLAKRGWIDRKTSNGSHTLAASPRSAPYALNSRTSATTGTPEKGTIEHSVAIGANYSKIRIGADLRFVQRGAPVTVPAHDFEIRSAGATIGLIDNGDPGAGIAQIGVACLQTDGGTAYVAPLASRSEDWARYEYVVTAADAGRMVLEVFRDGVSLGSGQCAGPLAASSTLEIGAWTNGANGPIEHEVDNVVVEVEP